MVRPIVSSRRLYHALCVAAALACPLALAEQRQRPAAPPEDPNGDTKASPPLQINPTRPPWHDATGQAPQQDPKALEILKAGIKALGGEEAILGRKTIYIKRKVISHEYPEPRDGVILLWFKRPNKLRKEIDYTGTKHVEVFDGERAWFDSGSGPQPRGQVMAASVLDGIKELDLPVNYLDAELTYFNISQEIPGKLAHVVKVRKNGYTKELMFDVTSSLLEVSGEYENPWGATDKMIKFDRYRPVDGVMVPFRAEHWRSNRMISETEILEIKFNAPVDDSLFQMPPASSSSHQVAKP